MIKSREFSNKLTHSENNSIPVGKNQYSPTTSKIRITEKNSTYSNFSETSENMLEENFSVITPTISNGASITDNEISEVNIINRVAMLPKYMYHPNNKQRSINF